MVAGVEVNVDAVKPPIYIGAVQELASTISVEADIVTDLLVVGTSVPPMT